MSSEYYSIQTVADVLNKNKYILRKWANNGKLVPDLNPRTHQKPYSKKQLSNYPEFAALFNSTWNDLIAISPKRPYRLLELFSGGGGMALGLEQAGFNAVLLNEKDKWACQTLRCNRPNWNVVESDIKDVSFTHLAGQIELLTGGFPCQSFSVAGKKVGLEDLRGTLFFEMARAIDEVKPKVFLAENVKGLLSNNNGETLKVMLSVIRELGYSLIEDSVYRALFFKVPQKRERLIIIGVRTDILDKLKYQPPSPYYRILTLADALKAGELYDCDVPDSVGDSYSEFKKSILVHVPEGGNWKDLPDNLQKQYLGKSLNAGGGKTSTAKRLAWNEPCSTLLCSPSQKQTERCHPDQTRPLTIREYARIQTFPDDWQFVGAKKNVYKQIGNAVPVNMALAIGKALISMFNQAPDNLFKDY